MGVRLSRAPVIAPAPFDVPCRGPEIPGGFVGVRHSAGALTTELVLTPGAAAPHRLGEPPAGTGVVLPAETITDWLTRPEAAAVEVLVRVHAGPAPRRGPAAAAYRTLLGPLEPIPERRVHLRVICRPLAHPALTARYGTGPAAALRYCVSATRRLAGLLRAAGIGVRALGAAEVSTAAPGEAVAALPGEPPAAPIPLSGSGPLLGADDTGRPIALPLAGPGIPAAAVIGDDDLARRVVARLTGLGLGCAIFTERPRRWSGLLDAVGDPALVHPAAAGPAPILVDDLPGARLGRLDGHTVLRIDGPGQRAEAGAPALVQDVRDRCRGVLVGGGRAIRVRLVGIPAEDALIGPD